MRQVTKKLMAPVYASWETNGERILHWGKLISITGSTQILIQAIGMIVGIMTVRLLPIKEYAWFTIANTMLGALTVLSDSGISSGVMAEAGKDWQNKELMGKVLSTGLYMRHRFALYSMIVTLPVLAYMLINNGAEWWQAALIILALIPAFYASLSDNLLEIPMKLHQSIAALQLNQLFAALGRLLLIVSSLLVLPFTFIALVSNGLTRIWANIQLRKKIIPYATAHALPDHEIRKSISAIVKRAMPGAIYFVLSSQITILIISIFGKTNSIAQFGALGRIGILFTIFATIISTIITPRFARLENTRGLLLKRYIQIQICVILFCLLLLLFGSVISNELLWILGDSYKGLNYELILTVSAGLLGLMAGVSYGLTLSKGWILKPTVGISVLLFSIIIGSIIFELGTLDGVLKFSIFQTFVGYILHTTYCLFKIKTITN